jgi:hypothetical protein
MAREYVNDVGPGSSMKFITEIMMGEESRARGLGGFVRNWLGNSRHRWMWDYETMAPELEKAGFVQIRRAAAGDSGIPAFDAVEDPGRWTNCLGVHCIKPAAG